MKVFVAFARTSGSVAIIALGVFCTFAQNAKQKPIRTLIFTGRNNADWRATTPCVAGMLAGTGRFDIRVEEEPTGTTAATLKNYDLLLSNYNGPRWGASTETAVIEF